MQGKLEARRRAGMRLAALGAVLTALFMFGTTPAFAVAPTVTSVSPAVGGVAGGTLVTITGNGFTGVTAVTFGGTAATSFNVVNTTTISATTPAHAAGVALVVVTTDAASGQAINFNYLVAPTVSTLAPTGGPTTGGNSVAITGTGLSNATAVSFGGTPGTGISLTNDNLISVTAPAHVAGAVDVTVTTPGGTSVAGAGTTYTYALPPAPVVTSVSPTTGTTAGGTLVTITGTNLLATSAVSFGGTAGTGISNVTATSLTVTAPAHVAGQFDVLVTTPSGQSLVSALAKYTYATPTNPVISTVSPASGPIAGGTIVTITGTGFTGATLVTFGGTAGTSLTVNGDTSITVTTPAHVSGLVDVFVTTPVGTSISSSVAKFTYTGVPTVTVVAPAGGPTTGGTTVTLTGTGFTGTTLVTFGGVAGTSITIGSDSSLTVVTPAHAAGTVDVIVTSPAGVSVAATTAKYTYGATVPTVTSVSPGVGGSGTVVTIAGTGFLGATGVTFGGTAGTSLTVTSDTSITVTAPAGTGLVDVIVTGPLGSSATGTQAKFSYQSATTSYTLTFRWSLVAWTGVDGVSVASALSGTENPDNPATNNIASSVTAIFRWNGAQQKWEAHFPASVNVPGANDFSTLSKGSAYWIATTGPGSIVWTVAQG